MEIFLKVFFDNRKKNYGFFQKQVFCCWMRHLNLLTIPAIQLLTEKFCNIESSFWILSWKHFVENVLIASSNFAMYYYFCNRKNCKMLFLGNDGWLILLLSRKICKKITFSSSRNRTRTGRMAGRHSINYTTASGCKLF